MVIKIHNSKTVSDKQAYWVSPSNSDTFLQPAMLFNIVFKFPQFKKKSIEKRANSSPTVPKDGLNSPPLKRKSPITKATSSEMDIFFKNLIKSDNKPAMLWIFPGYAEKFRSKSFDTPCKSFNNLYLDSCLNMPFQDLRKKNAMKFLNPIQSPRTRH